MMYPGLLAETIKTSNELLCAVGEAAFARLAPHLVRVRLVRDQTLIVRGHAADHVYFIETGLALLLSGAADPHPGVQVAMIGRDGLVGGLALLDGTSAAASAAVMQIPGTALRMPVPVLARLMEEDAAIRSVMMRSVQTLARQAMQLAAWNATDTLQQRCVRWLLMARDRLDGDDISITQEALSVILGVRRSSVTIAITALQNQGMVRTNRGRISIVDRHRLHALLDHGAPGETP